LRFVALRYFNVTGADPHLRTGLRTRNATHLIKVCSEVAVNKREAVTVFGTDYPTVDGTGVRDYIHVADLAEAHLRALRYLADGGNATILNCGYGRGISVRQTIDAFDRVLGCPLPRVLGPRRAGDASQIVADNRQILERLDWRPRFDDIDTIIRSALDWERMLDAEREAS
jgi:UDP-glucose 4-epimerase